MSIKHVLCFYVVSTFALYSCKDEGRAEPTSANYSTGLPHIFITTQNNQQIVSRDTYVTATIRITEGETDTFTGKMQIKLRGNTTSTFPKKPYHIKLDEAASILGLDKNRDWILLANFLDETLMTNAVAMQIGHLVGMPFTNHIVPVDVSLNNQYLGQYNFTEKIEVAGSRINIEDGGLLIELDRYFDAPWKFKSAQFDLPVMVHYPNIADTSALQSIKVDFELFTAAVASPDFPNNNYLDYIDETSLLNYYVVMLLTSNREINHPKSTFLYKPKDKKYHLGPLWDFDWAFGYQKDVGHFYAYNRPMFWTPYEDYTGTSFFHKFLKDPRIKSELINRLDYFKKVRLIDLINFVKDYSDLIGPSYKRDYEVWHHDQPWRSSGLNTDKIEIWINNRVSFAEEYLQQF